MKKLLISISIPFLSFSSADFKQVQLSYPRVRNAYAEKESALKQTIQSKGLLWQQHIAIRVMKTEQQLEVWIKEKNSGRLSLFKTYPICSASGLVGPKRKQGDHQVPEGVYYIDRFNPASNFHLSLGLNYPNASDQLKSGSQNPGGDIFIHGSCVSIGCMAMTDEVIKELYVLCVEAKQNGQAHIPVYIFPCNMTQSKMSVLNTEYPQYKIFWHNLTSVFSYWEENHNLPQITVDATGNYRIQ